MQLAYLIEYVADMDRAVAFYRDLMGLPLKFMTPEWSEFATGETTFALHKAGRDKQAGRLEAGFTVPDIHQFYGEATARGVEFISPPRAEEFGTLAAVRDSEGALVSVSRMSK
jgi:lactoylglutathione lyase